MKQMYLDAILQSSVDNSIKDFFQSERKKVLYGAGNQARACWDIIRELGFNIEFLISKECCEPTFKDQIPIRDIDSIPSEDKDKYDVLIAINERYNHEIRELLTNKGFCHIYCSNSWNTTNKQLRFLFFEQYLKSKLVTYSIDDDQIQFQNFKIIGCHNQPTAYTSMLIGLFNDIIASSIFQDLSHLTEGPYEWGEVKIEENDVVFDLGANIGMFSCVAASKGGQVYAFEPTPATIELLKMNQALYARFKIVPYAVCNQIGMANFYCRTSESENVDIGSNSLYQRIHNFRTIEVNTITIDAFVEQEKLTRVDFIKADIEGAEQDMLRGAQNTLARFAPKLALCTYHLPDDKEVMERLILEANPNYWIEHRWKKLYAYVPIGA